MVTLGEPRDWLGVGKRVHWALDTSNSSKHSWRAVVGQTGSMGGSAEWVTRPVTFLWIYNFCLKYEKGMSGFFLGFFPSLRKETLFLHFLTHFLPQPTHSFFLFLSIYPSCLPWSTTWKNVNAHYEDKISFVKELWNLVSFCTFWTFCTGPPNKHKHKLDLTFKIWSHSNFAFQHC